MHLGSILVYGLMFIGFIVFCLTLKALLGIVVIPDDSIGIVTKKFAIGKNSALPDGHVVALNGEAGIQADTLAPGLYFWYWPWQYKVEHQKFTIIEQGKIGIIQSSDGSPIPQGRVLAHHVDCDGFQNARAFLQNGGERGPQIDIIGPGTYRLNTVLFEIKTADAIQIQQGLVGIVTTREGKALPTGEIAGEEVQKHASFQNGQMFIENGGFKGLQEQVLNAGTFFINPLFASVEPVKLSQVPIGHVGVVVAYVGTVANQLEAGNMQGMIVKKGEKGVWSTPLDPGKYPINPYTHKMELVPTTNIVLNWANTKSEAHNLDKDLNPITVRSGDGFTFNLDVQQIIHIPRGSASKVIAHFGTMENLVTQVLEPLIGNYFRNSAQQSDVIEFLKNRSTRQTEAKGHIERALTSYNVQAVDTLIGDITPPQSLMDTLTARKIAEQEALTYATQEIAQVARAKQQEQQALADTKGQVVQADRAVEIAERTANASVKKAEGEKAAAVLNSEGQATVRQNLAAADAKVKTVTAQADAEVRTVNAKAEADAKIMVGDAEGAADRAVGLAQAAVLAAKVAAVGPDNYTTMQVVDELASNKIKLVPEVQVSSGSEGGNSGGMISALIANLLANGQRPRLPVKTDV